MLENESQRAVLRGRPRALPKTSKSEVEEKISEMKRLVGDDKDFTALFEEAKVQLFFFFSAAPSALSIFHGENLLRMNM